MISTSEIASSLAVHASQISELTAIRDATVAAWEKLTGHGWRYNTGIVRTIHPPYPANPIIIPHRGIQSVSQVRELNSAGLYTALSATSYYLVGMDLHRVSGTFEEPIEVTFDGGYTSATCPADVQGALLNQIKFAWRRFADENIMLVSKTFEGGMAMYLTPDFHPQFKKLAGLYSLRV